MATVILVSSWLPQHVIVGSFDSPIPLWVFLIASGLTVFGTALFRRQLTGPSGQEPPERTRTLPRSLVQLFSALGVIAVAWVAIQGLIGGSSVARVDVLFLWLTGWVLLPILAAFGYHLYPIIDPWRRIALMIKPAAHRTIATTDLPPAWLGIAAVAAIIALELVWTGGRGGPALFSGFLIHGTWVVAGRIFATEPELWAARFDPLTIVNNFLASNSRWQLVGDPDNGGFVQKSSRELITAPSTFALAALLVGAVIYDGLSQTEIWFRAFGLPTSFSRAGLLILVVAIVGGLSLAATMTTRQTGTTTSTARGLVVAGLRPVALGYIIAHYGPSVIAAAPYWLVALADPLQRGWNLLGLAYVASSVAPLPGIAVWVGQVFAVVGGHIAGIRASHRLAHNGANQLAATLLLVALTMLTLWTLGQSVVSSD